MPDEVTTIDRPVPVGPRPEGPGDAGDSPPPSSESRAQPVNTRQVHNRVGAVMAHVPWYGCRSQARLAADAGVSEAALSRFLAGHSNPSYAMVEAIARALERRLKRTIPPREIVSMDGTYPTASACDLAGCRNCCPPRVYETDEFYHTRLGQFSHPTDIPIEEPPDEVVIGEIGTEAL